MKARASEKRAGSLPGNKIRALVIGHTGATGRALLDALIASPDCESIVAIGRRESVAHRGSPKLTQHVVANMLDVGSLAPEIADGSNAAFCCIGTAFNDVFKKKKAAEFRSTDFGIATEFASFAKSAGVQYFSLISGQGVDAKSRLNMYRVKGEAEDFVRKLGFARITFLRPGSLHRGADATWTERIITLGGLVGLPVSQLAQAMVWMSLTQSAPVAAYNSKEIRHAASKFNEGRGK